VIFISALPTVDVQYQPKTLARDGKGERHQRVPKPFGDAATQHGSSIYPE
jgi:hypothetical protein